MSTRRSLLQKEVRIHLEKVDEVTTVSPTRGSESSIVTEEEDEDQEEEGRGPSPSTSSLKRDSSSERDTGRWTRRKNSETPTPDPKKLIQTIFAKPKKEKTKKRRASSSPKKRKRHPMSRLLPLDCTSTLSSLIDDDNSSRQDDDDVGQTEGVEGMDGAGLGIGNEEGEEGHALIETSQLHQQHEGEDEEEEVEMPDIRRRLRRRGGSGNDEDEDNVSASEDEKRSKSSEIKPSGRQTNNSRNAAAFCGNEDDNDDVISINEDEAETMSRKFDDDEDGQSEQWKPVRAAMVAAMELVAKKQVTEDMRERRVKKQTTKSHLPKGRSRRAIFKRINKPIKSCEGTAHPNVVDVAYCNQTMFHKGDVVCLIKDLCRRQHPDLQTFRFFQVTGILKRPLEDDCAGLVLLHRVVPLPTPIPLPVPDDCESSDEENDAYQDYLEKYVPTRLTIYKEMEEQDRIQQEQEEKNNAERKEEDEEEEEPEETNEEEDDFSSVFNIMHYRPANDKEILVPLHELKFVMRCPPDFFYGHDLLHQTAMPSRIYTRLGTDFYKYEDVIYTKNLMNPPTSPLPERKRIMAESEHDSTSSSEESVCSDIEAFPASQEQESQQTLNVVDGDSSTPTLVPFEKVVPAANVDADSE